LERLKKGEVPVEQNFSLFSLLIPTGKAHPKSLFFFL
jgi:hypothetical protein